jgi:hypothetical protein
VDEVVLKTQPEIALQLLSSLKSLCAAEYAQWIIEDPDDSEYRVVASLIPDGAEAYNTAHRTGIIGQVFRTEESILAMGIRNHPLYDTFDDSVDWELCFPVFVDGTLEGVINLEGTGELAVDQDLWATILRLVEEITRYRPPASLPTADSARLFQTRKFLIRAVPGENAGAFIELAQATARGGRHTLLVGDYPNLVRGRGPSIVEAIQRGLGISYCFFAVEQRLDLLATGPNAHEVLPAHPKWWNLCDGRYEFVVIQVT